MSAPILNFAEWLEQKVVRARAAQGEAATEFAAARFKLEAANHDLSTLLDVKSKYEEDCR